jgi:hypothetical protein
VIGGWLIARSGSPASCMAFFRAVHPCLAPAKIQAITDLERARAMNIPLSALDIAQHLNPDLFGPDEPPGNAAQVFALQQAQKILDMIRVPKSMAIEMLECKIAELQAQNTVLQAHNTELTLRARKAEERIQSLGESGSPQ